MSLAAAAAERHVEGDQPRAGVVVGRGVSCAQGVLRGRASKSAPSGAGQSGAPGAERGGESGRRAVVGGRAESAAGAARGVGGGRGGGVGAAAARATASAAAGGARPRARRRRRGAASAAGARRPRRGAAAGAASAVAAAASAARASTWSGSARQLDVRSRPRPAAASAWSSARPSARRSPEVRSAAEQAVELGLEGVELGEHAVGGGLDAGDVVGGLGAGGGAHLGGAALGGLEDQADLLGGAARRSTGRAAADVGLELVGDAAEVLVHRRGVVAAPPGGEVAALDPVPIHDRSG